MRTIHRISSTICLLLVLLLSTACDEFTLGLTSSDPNYDVYTVAGRIDPLTVSGSGPALRSDEKGLYLVQFKDVITAEVRKLLLGMDVTPGERLVHRSMIVRASPGQAEQLAAHDLVRTVLRYRPEWKVERALPKSGTVRVRVVTFTGRARPLASMAADRFGSTRLNVDDIPEGGSYPHDGRFPKATVEMQIPSTALSDLARIEDVVSITPLGDPTSSDSPIYLYTKSGWFDPLLMMGHESPLSADQPAQFVVQMKGPDPGIQDYLKSKGLKYRYFPQHGYVVVTTPATARAMAGDTLVRAVVHFHPDWKRSESEWLPATGEVEVRVDICPGTEETVKKELQRLGATSVSGGDDRVYATLPASVIPDLVQREEVNWIEPVGKIGPPSY